jgi:Fe-S cluster assembly scaffold protein SufB
VDAFGLARQQARKRAIAGAEVGAVLGWMSTRVLGQYDLLVAEDESPEDQDIVYYAAPKQTSEKKQSLDEVDPKLLQTYEKLGVPLHERARLAGVAVDAVFDSVSVATTFKDKLAEAGVIFCSMSEALEKHPELVQQYLGTVVPTGDNFFAALNAAVASSRERLAGSLPIAEATGAMTAA